MMQFSVMKPSCAGLKGRGFLMSLIMTTVTQKMIGQGQRESGSEQRLIGQDQKENSSEQRLKILMTLR